MVNKIRECIICSAKLKNNKTKLCGAEECLSKYNAQRQKEYRRNKKRRVRNELALQTDSQFVKIKNPPIRYKGSKWRLSEWVTSYFPEHVSYVEPFCGGASIFFRKSPSAIETLNDLNKNVVTFFDVLRARPEELIQAIQLTPFSREEWKNAHGPTPDSQLEIARRFYIRSRMSFDSGEGKYRSGWRYMKNNARCKSLTSEWNDVSMLWSAARRLKDAQIECDDALRVIERFDSPETLFYVDPPYLFDTRYRHVEYYAFEMSDNEHITLANLLNKVEGMVILSGYDHPLYHGLYKDWGFEQKAARTNGNFKATECLWINPSAINRKDIIRENYYLHKLFIPPNNGGFTT